MSDLGLNPDDYEEEIDEDEVDESHENTTEAVDKSINLKSEKKGFLLEVDSVQDMLNAITFANKQFENALDKFDMQTASENFSSVQVELTAIKDSVIHQQNELINLKKMINQSSIDSSIVSPIKNAVFELEKINNLEKAIKKFKTKTFSFVVVLGLLIGMSTSYGAGYFFGVSKLAAGHELKDSYYMLDRNKYKYIKQKNNYLYFQKLKDTK